MRKYLYRVSGILMTLVALITWVASILGLVYTWKLVPVVTATIYQKIDNASALLDSTQHLIEGVDDSLTQAKEKLTDISTTGKDIAAMAETTKTIISDIAGLSRDDFPALVSSVQVSLASMEISARLIDDTLGIITYLPFISTRYKPDVPLNLAVNQISHNLDNLPAVLIRIEKNMNNGATTMGVLKSDVLELVNQSDEIQTNLSMLQQTLAEYQTAIQKARDNLMSLRNNLSGWVSSFAWIITGFLVWISLIQVSGFLYGVEILSR